MPYQGLGPRGPVASQLDQTGLNTGNWTTQFTADVLNIGPAWVECYHAIAQDVPSGAAAVITVGTKPFSYTNPTGGSEWDPAQPLLLSRGQDVYFLWNVTAAGAPPKVTLWLRYDPTLPGNR